MLERFTRAIRGRHPPIATVTDGAAALTYYSVFSLFPGFALLISALALIDGSGNGDTVIEIVDAIAPPEVAAVLSEPIENLSANHGLSGAALAISGIIAVFSASRYVAAFGRTADRIQGMAPAAGAFWRRRPLSMLLVLGIVVLLPAALLALLITGPIAVAVGDALGVSKTVRDLFGVLRWPLLAIIGVGMLAILYLSSEAMRRATARRVLPGATVAITIWMVASALFSLFVAHLTDFSLIYGSLAGVALFLIWLYVSNLAVLAGVTVNASRLGAPGTTFGDRAEQREAPSTIGQGTGQTS